MRRSRNSGATNRIDSRMAAIHCSYCWLLGGSQPHIDTAWGTMFQAHGHGHEHQTTDLLRVIKAVLRAIQAPACTRPVPGRGAGLGPTTSHAPIRYSARHSHRGRQSHVRAKSERDCRENCRAGSETPPHPRRAQRRNTNWDICPPLLVIHRFN